MNKTITNAQILRTIKAHETGTYHKRNEVRAAVSNAVRYVLNGGSPYGSIRAANATSEMSFREAQAAVNHSDHSFMAGYEYVGFIADEVLYQAGLVDTDIEDYLNAKNISHGIQGRRYLAEAMAMFNAAPMWKEPSQQAIMEAIASKWGVALSNVRQGFKMATGAYSVIAFLREQKHALVVLPAQKKPRGYMGRIHNTMLQMGLSDRDEGFYYLRFAAWVVIRSGKRDRRLWLKDVVPVVAKKYGKGDGAVISAMNAAIVHAALGGLYSEVLFRLVNTLEPQGKPLYQMADEILRAHGFGARQRLKGYECVRVAMVKLAEDSSLFGKSPSKTFDQVNSELGYVKYAHGGSMAHSYVHYFLRPYKETQESSPWEMVKKLACELESSAYLQQTA